ncbi:MAG: Gfo/Idh/MocA family protein [Planctomycetota bacterium]
MPDSKSDVRSNSPLSRRTFLQGAAVVAAPVVLGRRAHAIGKRDPDVLKVGLIGCGGRGTGAAYNAVRAENGTVVLTALADLFADRIDSCVEGLTTELGPEQAGRVQVDPEHRFTGFDAAEKLLRSDVDVVILATPPHFRPAQLRAAVEAGKHIFCEKPVAVDAPGVRSVFDTVELARAKKLALVSGFCWRSKYGHRALYSKVHDGAIGSLRAIYSTYLASPNTTRKRESAWSDMEFHMRNWYNFVWLSGDHIVEQAVHSIDKMAWALRDEPPLSVVALGGRQAREGDESGNAWDHFSATYEYKDGVQGIHVTRQWPGAFNQNDDMVLGEKGVATINGWDNDFRIRGETPWAFEGEDNDMYQTELDELFAAIRAGRERNDGVWMTRSTMLAIMARMAAYTGEKLTWEQALASQETYGLERYELGKLALAPVAVPGHTRFF